MAWVFRNGHIRNVNSTHDVIFFTSLARVECYPKGKNLLQSSGLLGLLFSIIKYVSPKTKMKKGKPRRLFQCREVISLFCSECRPAQVE